MLAMDREQRRQLTFALTLAGGIVLIAGALLMLVFMAVVFGLAIGPQVQGDLPPEFPGWAFGGLFGVIALIPIVCGIVTLLAARRYRQDEGEARKNGMMAIVAGAIGLIGGGGGFVGAGLAIAGGVMMLTEPDDAATSTPERAS